MTKTKCYNKQHSTGIEVYFRYCQNNYGLRVLNLGCCELNNVVCVIKVSLFG